MGQKVNPNGFRRGIITTWPSLWYAEGQDYAKLLHEDIKIRNHLRDKLKGAGISEMQIERPSKKKLNVTIHAVRPGVIIGKKGADLDKIRKELELIALSEVSINIMEVKKPEISAILVANAVAKQLEGRVAFRKAMKRAMQSAMRMGAKGIKISVSGRLGGAEIARTEWYREGRVPLHTLRAKIEFAIAEAHTTYGIIGVKVWVYLGDVLEKSNTEGGR